jgi:hypothetical protein
MTLIYAAAKGLPLTDEDLDRNFRALELRLEHHSQTEPAYQWILEGDVLFHQDPEGKKMVGRLPLPLLKPAGKWQAQQSYVPYDMVCWEGRVWMCQKAHTSGDTFSEQESCWVLFWEGAP